MVQRKELRFNFLFQFDERYNRLFFVYKMCSKDTNLPCRTCNKERVGGGPIVQEQSILILSNFDFKFIKSVPLL